MRRRSSLIPRFRSPWIPCAFLFVLSLASPAAAQGDHAPKSGELGVALAMHGESSRAESVFVSMLSHTRGDARALNGLGNLRLLRGDLGVALAFYDRALRGDSADAGIHLNRATALMLLGDDARARDAARTGIQLAGSLDAAQALLGLTPDAGDAAREADRTALISKEEIRTLLRSAASVAPVDTVRSAVRSLVPAKKRAPSWSPSGPRASDPADGASSASLLYWKD